MRRVLFTANRSAYNSEENNVVNWSSRQVIIGKFVVISSPITSGLELRMIGLLTATASLGQASLMKEIRLVDLLVERNSLRVAWRLASSANERSGHVHAVSPRFICTLATPYIVCTFKTDIRIGSRSPCFTVIIQQHSFMKRKFALEITLTEQKWDSWKAFMIYSVKYVRQSCKRVYAL